MTTETILKQNPATEFVKTDYVNWSCKVFEGFYESGLYNSDTLYDITYNDRGETTIDENGNEVPILKDDEEYDFTETGWKEFQEDVAKYAVDKLEELATEYRNEDQMILKNFSLHGVRSPRYYNFETDKLHIDLEVNVRALENFCFYNNRKEFNDYLNDNFTSYDGFISYIDNNVDDFKREYNIKGIDSAEGNCMIEFYLLTCIYETNDLRTVEGVYDDEYTYHFDLAEYASSAIWDYIEPTKI